jgi:hypothetical protein
MKKKKKMHGNTEHAIMFIDGSENWLIDESSLEKQSQPFQANRYWQLILYQ